MNQGKYVFSQLMSLVSHNDFNACVERYGGDYKVKEFTCWKQFLCMAFGQLTHRESLSDTVLCLSKLDSKLYHLGIGKAITKSTLSKANENRDWRIYADLARNLIFQAKAMYGVDSDLDIEINGDVFAIDATVIDLCLSVYPWAKFRRAKSAVKLTTQLNLKNAIPEYIEITSAAVHEVKTLDDINFQPGSIYVMDRGYIDYKRLYKIHLVEAFFVIRAKNNLQYRLIKSFKANKAIGVYCDQKIKLKNKLVATYYPQEMRRIKFKDFESDKTFVFLTNNNNLTAVEIAQLYKYRWKIELFFKWIKQHLKIKSFWGTSINAVKTQVWIAITVYLLILIAKRKYKIEQTLYEMLQLFSITSLERTSITELFSQEIMSKNEELKANQLKMFE